jgi:chemotaxis protein MotC
MRVLAYSVAVLALIGWAAALRAQGHDAPAAPAAAPAPATDVQATDTRDKDTKPKTEAPAQDVQAKDAPVRDVQAADAGGATPQPPYRMVRTLEHIQDGIAQGNSQAHSFQREFIGEIAEKMLSAPDATWQDAKNLRAVIVYVLSGGDPRILKKLLTIDLPPAFPTSLLRGLLAYSEGRNREALKALTEVDHRAYDTRTGCHLALAKAMVQAPEDVHKALVLLDDARLLCPGTLVEEAALRRQVLLLSNADDNQRFEMLAFAYLRRYPRSIYARNFARSFAVTVTSGRYAVDPVLMERLVRRIDDLPNETRRRLYLALAEEGVTRGRIELTRIAADKAAPLVAPNSRDVVRLELYRAAAMVVTKDYDVALGKLRAIDRSKLSTSDVQLLVNALALAAEVREPPQIEGPVAQLPPLSSATQVKYGAIAEKSEALDRARAALGQADVLLSKDRR